MITLPPAEQLLKPVEIKPVVIKPVVIKPSKPATPTVTPPSSPQPEKKSEKKAVRFHGAVKVALFERASSTEAEQGWYSPSQLEEMKDQGSELAAAYRKFCANGGDNDDRMKKSDYRGVEHQTIIRQKQMILANQSALYAQELGLSANEIATLYGKGASWSSTKVAFVQAVHDHLDASAGDDEDDNAFVGIDLPQVSSMRPPRPNAFAMQSVRTLRSRAMATSTKRSRTADALAPITSRRVRRRVAE